MSLSRFLRARRTQQQQVSDESTDSPGRELGRGIADGAVVALTIAKNSTDWNPITKGVLGGVSEIIDLCRQFKSNKESWKDFSDYLGDLQQSIEEQLAASNQAPSNSGLREMRQLASALEAISVKVIKMKDRPRYLKVLQTREDPKVIAGFRQLISEQLQKFLVTSIIAVRMSNSAQASNSMVQAITMDFSTTLPPIPAHFYGRDVYTQNAVGKLLESLTSKKSANLAIMGPGGIGKTTVASAILHHQAIKNHFGAHIFFVSCEAIKSGPILAAAIMKAFDLSLGDGDVAKNFLTAISSYVFPALLCLDNFETPWDSEDNQTITTLLMHLTSLQMITVLLTMRGTEIPIKHKTHWVQMPVLGTLDEDEAIKTFLAIGELVQPAAYQQINELVKCLDCMPLAITLLARRHCVSGEPIHQLIKLWKEQKIMSKATSKDDNMDVSISLSLNSKKMVDCPNALRLLTIMSHLPDGVAGDDIPLMVSMKDDEISEAVFTLQSTSLAFVDKSGRLGTLSPIRLYMLHHQQILQEDISILQQFVFGLTDNWRTTIGKSEYMYTKQQLDSEWRNISSLLMEWLEDAPGDEDVLESILSATCAMKFHIPDGLLVQQAARNSAVNTPAHAKCLQMLGNILEVQAKYSEAEEKVKSAMVEFKKIGDNLGAAQCLQSLGDIHRMQAKYSEAEEKLESAMDEFKRIGDNLGAAQCLQSLGNIHQMQAKYSKAEEKVESAMVEFKRIGDNLGAAQCLWSLGNILGMQVKYSEAEEKLESAMAEFKRIGDNLGAAQCLQSLGNILQMQDKYSEAEEKLESAMAEFKRIGENMGAAQCLKSLGDILRMQDKYSEAEEKLESAMAEFKRIGDKLGVAYCLQIFALIHLVHAEYADAHVKMNDACNFFKQIGIRIQASWCEARLVEIQQKIETRCE